MPGGGLPAVFGRADPAAPMPEFGVTAVEMIHPPSVVVSRAFLRTVRGPEELRTTAVFRFETAQPTVVVALPSGARWLRARLGAAELREVELESTPDRYRCRLPSTSTMGPRSLAIDYAQPAARAGAWEPGYLVGEVIGASLLGGGRGRRPGRARHASGLVGREPMALDQVCLDEDSRPTRRRTPRLGLRRVDRIRRALPGARRASTLTSSARRTASGLCP